MSQRQDQERGWDGASIDRVFDLGSTEEVSGARASTEGLESDAVAELRGLCREALTGEPAREATVREATAVRRARSGLSCGAGEAVVALAGVG